MVPGLMVAGLGFGLVLAPIATAVVNSAPAEERGVASALVIILRLVGMSLGGSIALSWGTQRVQALSAEFAAGQSQFAVDTLAIFRHATAQAVAESFLLFAVVACLIAAVACAVDARHAGRATAPCRLAALSCRTPVGQCHLRGLFGGINRVAPECLCLPALSGG